MSATAIEWAEHVWNPVAGCTRVSPGCDNCYAATMTRRLEAMGQADYSGLTTPKHFNGKINLLPHKLDVPLRRKKPTRWFVNSMSDLFHKDVPDEFIDQVFAVMANCPQHQFLVLTKRPERMAEYLTALEYRAWVTPKDGTAVWSRPHGQDHLVTNWPLPNVWLGVSCENQEQADKRIPLLLQTPAAIRFLSCEPLLGRVSLECSCFSPTWIRFYPDQRIHWVIVGGESGPGARPMHPDWARSIRNQCKSASSPFFFKQWGSWAAIGTFSEGLPNRYHRFADGTTMQRVGKKKAGRLLDGIEHNDLPEGAATHADATKTGNGG